MRRWLPIAWLWPLVACAADFPDLPPAAEVARVLRGHPLVRAAEAGMRVEAANRDRLEAGPHEFALKLQAQQRHERLPDLRYREQEIGLERAVRLPGKAAQDAALGAAGVALARDAFGDAMHEAARQLLGSWFAWQREATLAREWAAQVALLREQHDAVLKKVAAGDAARIEASAAEAQLAQAEAQLAQAEARCERAGVELTQHFPGIALPQVIAPSPPQAPQGAAEDWQERILAHNHELAVARGQARRALLAAQRLDAERLPDPTLGLRFASERDGEERVVGLALTVPLPGEGRAAGARAASAEAEAAAAREALALARAQAQARHTVGLAASSYAQWQRLEAVASRMEENARLIDRAWRLGEGQFDQLQQARRQAIEARLAAAQARLDASEARYRLLLDAHALWPLPDADAETP